MKFAKKSLHLFWRNFIVQIVKFRQAYHHHLIYNQ